MVSGKPYLPRGLVERVEEQAENAMISIRDLYRIGPGPSSSHTIGVKNAVDYIVRHYPDCARVEMTFYGSLAKTGKGHLSDFIADRTFQSVPHRIEFDAETKTDHPNTMVFRVFQKDGKVEKVTVLSVGGGLIRIADRPEEKERQVYSENTFAEIKAYCLKNRCALIDYIYRCEGKEINAYMDVILSAMLSSVESGLNKSGVLPGKLNVHRKAREIYRHIDRDETPEMKEKRLICAYAFAVCEENASGEQIVTAPTCGSSGVLPSLVRHCLDKGTERKKVIEGLLIAGLFGVLVKTNASISGAECGCQAEIGTASAMGAAFLAYLDGQRIEGIERAAEIALEHSLGLTCDPIGGYVQIPCIERNAMGAMKSLTSCAMSRFMGKSNSKISFDVVVETMYRTGHDINLRYRETAQGGLAEVYHPDIRK